MRIILASASGVRKKILDNYKIDSDVIVSNVDEDQIKESLLAANASPLEISKNLAELKSTRVSNKHPDRLVLGADSVISLDDKLINKPKSRKEALEILEKLNNSKHYLISSVCISRNGAMIWNHSEESELKMKNFEKEELIKYLEKIKTETLLAYGVYQIESDGLKLFEYIKGDIISRFYAAIGDNEKTIQWIKEMNNRKEMSFLILHNHPWLKSFQKSEEFIKIYKNAGIFEELFNSKF